ncbi:hypothetical protein D5086_005833 [Populus alba]|uniref:Uncharacterized protein n=1 Tax=Populus alba TaxID=43335 RepID=A0ACC4CUC1_POPAL
MADGAVSFLLDKLTTILLQKASLLGDARDKIEEIKLELESMKSFLRDAERSKEKSDSVETWVRQVREVAYEVEDIIDEFMHHKYKETLKNGFKGIVEGVVKFPKNITSRHRISSKLQKVIAKVHEVSERSKRYGFDPIDEEATRNVAGDRWQHYGESATFVDEDDIVGMEESTEQLLGWLMEDEPRRTVISIVGMGGLAYDGYPSKLEGKIHRLSVNSTGESIRLGSAMSHHLRSFFVFPTDTCSSFSLAVVSSKFKFLRVLDLEGVPIETMPGTLVELFNLRYLNLRDTDIRELPKSMERLNKLETLDVWNTYIERLPSGISKLSNLRHLFMLHKNGQNSQTTDALQAPGGIWNIRSLQTLACIEAEKELIQQVGNLTGLKRLEIAKLRAADGPKLCDSIQKLTGLLRLGVMATNTEEELQLEALPLTPLFLQKLTLIGHLNRLPPWIGSLENLTHLYLGYSRLQEDILSSIHVLSSLVFLELKKAYDGRALHFKEGWFPRLNKLNLVELVHLDSLKLEENSLPSIRELYLIRCQAMTALPQGIEHLNGLQKLHLEDMHEQLLQRFRSGIIEDQQKVQHIPTIKLVYITEQTRVVETL